MKKGIYSLTFGWLIIYITSFSIKSSIIYTSNDLKDLYLAYFSYLPINKSLIITDFIIPISHIIFVVYIFSGYVLNNIKKRGVIIFTRTDKKEKWLLKEYLKMFIKLNLYFGVQFILFFILGILNNIYIVDIREFISVVVLLFIVQVLSSYILILFSNIISIYSNTVYGYFTSVISLCISIVILNILYSCDKMWLIKYLPFTQHLIILNELNFINRNIELFNIKIQNYNLIINGIVYILILTILIYISIKRVRKIDIL